MRSRPRTVVVAVCAAAALVLAVLGAMHLARPRHAAEEGDDPSAPIDAEIAVVTRGGLSDTVRVTGTLQALPDQEARVSAQIDGRVVDLHAKRGDTVRAGQRIATLYSADLAADVRRARAARQGALHESRQAQAGSSLDRESQAAELRQAQAALNAAQARLDTLQAGSRTEDIAEAQAAVQREEADLRSLQSGSRPLEIEQAEARLREAEAELAKLQAGPRPQEVAQAEAAVREAEANVEVADATAQRVSALFEDGLASAQEKERAAADRTAARAALQTAQQQLALLREGTRTEEIQAQTAKVHEMQAALQLARAGPRPEEIEAQKAAVEQARQTLAKLEAGPRPQEIREAEAAVNEAEATLSAAAAGRWQVRSAQLGAEAARSRADEAADSVAVAEAELGKATVTSPVTGVIAEVLVNQGEVVSAGQPILKVVNAQALRVIAQVPAAYEALLQVGQPAVVTFPHLPGAKVDASVDIIGSVVGADTGLIPIELLVPNDGGRLAAGMAAEVELSVERSGDVLLIPASAVFSRAGEQYVYVLDVQNRAEERLVETGADSGDKLEVRAGLAEGERIIADGTFSIADGVEVQPLP